MLARRKKAIESDSTDELESLRTESLLKPILWVMVGLSILAGATVLWYRAYLEWGLAFVALIWLTELISWFLILRGRSQLAAAILSFALWAVIAEATLVFGGVRGPGLAGFILVLLVGRLILTKRLQGVLTALVIASLILALLLDVSGVLKPNELPTNSAGTWLIQMISFIGALVAFYLINRRFSGELEKARLEKKHLEEVSQADRDATDTLKNRADILERRVVQLQVAAAVARDTTTVRELDRMLSRAVNLISDRFGFYHAGIFLIDEQGNYAVLKAASGEAGTRMLEEGHRLRVGATGIVGYVTGSGLSRLALDVGSDAVHFKNPYLPETRSEMALPLKLGSQVIGALDVQSQKPNAFDSEDLTVLQTMADQLAVAIENARLLEATSRQLEELSVLHSVADAGAEATDVDSLIEQAIAVIGETLYPDNIGVWLLDENTGKLHIHRSYRGIPVDLRAKEIQLGEGFIGSTVKDGQVRRTGNIKLDPVAIQGIPGMNSELCVPLKAGEKVIGAVNAESSLPDAFTAADERLLATFAGQLSTAIERVQLFATVRRRAAELEAIRQAGLHLTSNLELQPVLEEILEHALELVSADYAHIFLFDGVKLTFGASLWSGQPQREPYTEPRDNGLTYQVARTGEMLVIEDMHTDPLYRGENWQGAVVGLPLRSGSQVIGVMHISYNHGPHRFDEDELNVLKMLADEAAIGLANARLYSELQAHAQELAAALVQRDELVRLKSEFIQNVSHELRTPLAIARGYVDLLDSGDMGELKGDQKDVIAIVSRRIQMLTRMVDDLTAILESERPESHREPVDLTELVQRLLADFSPTAYQAGLTLATEITPNLPSITGNPTHIQRVLDNLVGNAVKFTPRGGTITVRLCPEGRYILMEVSDTGIGIAENELGRIFDRFYQVDGSTTRRFGGAGLGLALVREIVQTHGGLINVRSKVGQGTTFEVRLPVSQ